MSLIFSSVFVNTTRLGPVNGVLYIMHKSANAVQVFAIAFLALNFVGYRCTFRRLFMRLDDLGHFTMLGIVS